MIRHESIVTALIGAADRPARRAPRLNVLQGREYE
jgi:hypothetical protein